MRLLAYICIIWQAVSSTATTAPTTKPKPKPTLSRTSRPSYRGRPKTSMPSRPTRVSRTRAPRRPSMKPSTKRTSVPTSKTARYPPSARKPTPRPTLRNKATRVPSAVPHSHPRNSNYNKFLFLGDSLIARWLCFSKGQSVPFVPSDECNTATNTYFEIPSNLAVNCAGNTSYYCKSAFQSAFPNAITFAVRGFEIEDVTNRALTYAPLQLLASGSVQVISYIIIEIGTNNIWFGNPVTNAQYANGASLLPIISLYTNMVNAVHQKFPRAQILLLSVTPYRSDDPSDDNKFRKAFNLLLNSTYSNSAAYPYVQFSNITRYFYASPGYVRETLFNDVVHFSDQGYVEFEKAIKNSIRTAFPAFR